MSGPDFTVDSDAPQPFAQRIAGAVRAWASTEVGGWTVVGLLAALALAAVIALLIVPRMQKGADPTASTVLTAGQGVQGPVADLTEFTLAPDAIQDFSYDQARLWNAGLPFSTDPIRPAAPLIAPTADIEAYGRALDCLTAAIYYEAASETPQGQAAVAQVVLNRARHPAYPRTVCGVVFQGSDRVTGCQFSFTCDGAMARVPSPAGWNRARSVATAALNGAVAASVGTATHYHTDWVAPYWAPRLTKLAKIGTHIFYRWNGAWGLPSAFTGVYSGIEPIVPKMAALTTIKAALPAEILELAELAPTLPETDASRVSPRLAVGTFQSAGADLAAGLDTADQPAVPPPPVPPAPVIQRDVPIMADPLVSPAEPARRRQRIAAPSGW
ncbi:cell wall hydrolase [Brevundimonas sp.]|uniref:cell wall hydrolase n=1 Tax=Brevundimonas sp. TaxID=1871086 RepID=UPI00286A0C30|nr:cell wall hydrolase [Brevundimonas sp.]